MAPVRGGRARREPSSATDPQPRAEADVQPRPAKRARAAVDRGESAPSTASAAGRSPAAHALDPRIPSTGRHPNDAGWEAQLAKLEEYKRTHGDCSVPYEWAEDPRLAAWVNTQRVRIAIGRGII